MSLKDFVNKYNNKAGKYAYTIDPVKTFSCYMSFPEGETGAANNKSIIAKAVGSALDTLTGGLLSKAGAGTVQGPFKNIPEIIKATQFEDSTGQIFDCTYFIQSASLPQLQVIDAERVDTVLGSLQMHKLFLEPSNKTFSMAVVNTKASLLERIFYPWMREVTLPYWSYPDYPFTTAEVVFDMTPHNVIKYHFLGCRPTAIEMINPTQQLDTNLTRNVTMTFDYAFVELADNKTGETAGDALKKLGGSLVSKAMSTIGL